VNTKNNRAVFITVFSIVSITLFLVIGLNLMQTHCPSRLPDILKTWKFMPFFTRSLKPYDYIIMNFLCCCTCCRDLVINKQTEDVEENSTYEKQMELSRLPAATNFAYEIERF
jgi:hypothetical protein